ncbi:hypothetical protein B0H11DRAFT_2248850 [Mycena galericulata]|nr:hypothetical protein B0H11DRAFT_2248850 [Mycena galericulata]
MDSKLWLPSRQNLNSLHSFTRRRFVWAVLVLGGALACLALFTMWNSDALSSHPETLWFGRTGISELQAAGDPLRLDPMPAVNGPPTRSFRDNLRSDTKYITSWGSGGWSNDVISTINLIYLGLITDRVPVIPIFLPSHLMLNTMGSEFSNSILKFGDVFDLPRLRAAIGKPVLEWGDVKASNSTALDELGCWNVWESSQYHDKAPRKSFAPWKLGLDVSYTKTPDWVKMMPEFEHDRYSSFWSLASLAFPSTRAANLVPPLPSPKRNATLSPDEHLLCFDFLYYVAAHHVAAHQVDEIGEDYSPAWRYVGQHMRWTPRLEQMGDAYIRRALGLREDAALPPFVAVHVRHNDFADWCEDGFTPDECFAPLSAITQRVREVQEEIADQKGVDATHVIVTSDEKNHTWWEGVHERGWLRPDHSRTKELYGDWYSILIDAVIQSKSTGFVGTARSTVSVLSNKRVESWQDGAVRTVQWGKPGADDH